MNNKLTFTLLLFITFIVVSVKAQTNWVKQPLDARITVKFPSTPKMSNSGGNVVYRDTDKAGVIYGAVMIDYVAVAHIDSAKLAVVKDTQKFADGLRYGVLQNARGYEFGNITMGKWNGYTSYSITGVNATTQTKKYYQMIFIGSKDYTVSCILPDAATSKSKDDYFAMIELSH